MAKLMTFMMIIIGIILILYVAGVTTNETNTMKDVLLLKSSNDLSQTHFYTGVLLAIGLLAGAAAIFAGFFSSSNFISVVASASMASLLGLFATDFYWVVTKVGSSCDPSAICSDWVYWIVWVIFIPITFGYILSMIEWIMGDH